jgi:catechol 2,3-dioxygenase-like lactoylglutathione lyase family enzyme
MTGSARSDRPRVTGAYGFGLEVPAPSAAEAYFLSLGMEVRDRRRELTMGCAGRAQDELVISVGPRKRLHHIAFSIDAGDSEAFADLLRERGIDYQHEPPDGGYREGLWFMDPWGTWINLVPQCQAPMRDAGRPLRANTFGQRNRVGQLAYQELDQSGRPLRFQHVLIFTPAIDSAEAYYCDVLGLGVSDRRAGFVSFLHAPAGDCWDHHCFAVVNNPTRGLHHCSFEMADIDQLGFCLQRMRETGYTGGFGPGRQFLGSNLFAYVRDPWGSHTEISTDMDQLDFSCKTKDWDEIPKLWGPEWEADFWTANAEAEGRG